MPVKPRKRARRGSITPTNRPVYHTASSLMAWEYLGAAEFDRQSLMREAAETAAKILGWDGKTAHAPPQKPKAPVTPPGGSVMDELAEFLERVGG